jgi:hypothetical protein
MEPTLEVEEENAVGKNFWNMVFLFATLVVVGLFSF